MFFSAKKPLHDSVSCIKISKFQAFKKIRVVFVVVCVFSSVGFAELADSNLDFCFENFTCASLQGIQGFSLSKNQKTT